MATTRRALFLALTLGISGMLPLLPGHAAPEPPAVHSTLKVEVARLSIAELCTLFTQRTGVPHRPKDAAAGDLQAYLAGDFTEDELKAALAETLGLEWRKTTPAGSPSMVVVERSAASLTAARKQQTEREQAFRDNLAALVRASRLSPEEVAKISDPALKAQASDPVSRRAARVLGGLPPVLTARLAQGVSFSLPASSLSPEARSAAAEILSSRPPERQGGAPDIREGTGWTVSVRRRPGQSTADTVSLFVEFRTATPQGFGVGINVNTVPELANDPASYRLAGARPVADAAQTGRAADGMAVRFVDWEQQLRALQPALQQPIVSDAYVPNPGVLRVRPPSITTVAELLDYVARVQQSRWGATGRVITFQRRDWAVRQLSQVPPSRVAHWRQTIVESGHLGWDDLAEMATLAPAQQSNLSQSVAAASTRDSWLEGLLAEHGALLALWSRVPARVRQKAETNGIIVQDLPLALQPQLVELLRGRLGPIPPALAYRTVLRVDRMPEAPSYSFTVPDRDPLRLTVDTSVPPATVQRIKKDLDDRRQLLERLGQG
jgi:hypothetical protein